MNNVAGLTNLLRGGNFLDEYVQQQKVSPRICYLRDRRQQNSIH